MLASTVAGNDLAGWLIYNGIARIAVPCFFIINGYFIGEQISDGKFVKKYIVRLLVIYATWTIINCLSFTYLHINRIILYITTGYFHLWYIVTLIVGVIILHILKWRIKNNWTLLIISIILILTGFYMQEYLFHFLSELTRKTTFRNGIFMGLPFVFFGYFIRNMEKKIHERVKTSYLLFIFSCSLVCLLIESYLSNITGTVKDIHLSLIIICPTLFLTILRYSRYSTNDGYIGKLAASVYFIHPLVCVLISPALNCSASNLILFPLIFFLSMVFSAGVIEINKRIKVFL
jgi:surface polysaccharide O-acyltransferase-like enzyme